MANKDKAGLSGNLSGQLHFGAPGATFRPHVEGGILSWTNDRNLENPDPVMIQGDDGKSPRIDVERGQDFQFRDGVWIKITNPGGDGEVDEEIGAFLYDGARGPQGESGVYIGSAEPPITARVWIDPDGTPSGSEKWEFEMQDGSTVTKNVVVV